ncbi:MAG: hypothetical protein AAFQ68_27325 [Bacteroidota bacterium]
MKAPTVFVLFLIALCTQSLQAQRCPLINALAEQYSQYRMGYLEYEVKRFTSYDVDTSIQRVHLSFEALPDRTPTESKDFAIHMHFPLGQHRRIQDGDCLYRIHEREQISVGAILAFCEAADRK